MCHSPSFKTNLNQALKLTAYLLNLNSIKKIERKLGALPKTERGKICSIFYTNNLGKIGSDCLQRDAETANPGIQGKRASLTESITKTMCWRMASNAAWVSRFLMAA